MKSHFNGQRTNRRSNHFPPHVSALPAYAKARSPFNKPLGALLLAMLPMLVASPLIAAPTSESRPTYVHVPSQVVGKTSSEPNLEFPSFDWSPVCTGDKCHEFQPDKDLIDNNEISSAASSTIDIIDGSYGYRVLQYPDQGSLDQLNGNTLIAHSLGNLKTMFVTAGNNYRGQGHLTLVGNLMIIDGQDTPININWVGSPYVSDIWDSASISAVTSNFACNVTDNTTALRSVTFQMTGEFPKNVLVIAGASVTGTDVAKEGDNAELSRNRLIMDHVTIHGVSPGFNEASYLYGMVNGRFNGDDTDPAHIQLENNGLYIKDSTLDIGGIVTTYMYTWKHSTCQSNVLWIENSTINMRFANDNGANDMSGRIGVNGGSSEGYNNVFVLKNSTINYDNTSAVKAPKISAYFIGESVADGNKILISDSTLNLRQTAQAKNAVYFYAGALNNGGIKDLETNRSDNNLINIQRTHFTGEAELDFFAGRINANGTQLGNQLYMDEVQMENPAILASFMFYNTSKFENLVKASNNQTSIQNSKFTGYVNFYAGYLATGNDITYDSSKKIDLSNNQITIEKTSIEDPTSRIYGVVLKANGGTQVSNNNVVEIGSNVKGANGGILVLNTLMGVFRPLEPTYWGEGNTLIARSPMKVTTSLGGFQVYQFDLTNYQVGQPFISYEGKAAHVLNTKNGDQTRSSFVILSAPKDLMGQELVLVHSSQGFVSLNTETGETTHLEAGDHSDLLGDANDVVTYQTLARQSRVSMNPDDMSLVIEENGTDASQDLVLTMEGGQWSDEANDQTSALMESALSSLGALTAADDLFMDQALRDQVLTQEGPFVAARTGRWSFDTNTRIESNITSAVMGYGHEVGINTHVGLFVEMGLGAYKTRTGLSDGSTSQGSGSQNYAGIGLFAMQKLPIEGLLLNGYVKAGGLQNRFDITMMNQGLAFNRTAAYWGANLGVMFDYPLTPKVATRSYLQYFYDGLGSQTFDKVAADLAITSSFHYDAINAHRIQLGTQVTYNYQPNLKPFIGIAIEDAIQAKATGTATDSQGTLSIKPSDMEGVTALLSAGWKYEREDQGLNVGLSATGYGGARNGVSAQVQATWAF